MAWWGWSWTCLKPPLTFIIAPCTGHDSSPLRFRQAMRRSSARRQSGEAEVQLQIRQADRKKKGRSHSKQLRKFGNLNTRDAGLGGWNTPRLTIYALRGGQRQEQGSLTATAGENCLSRHGRVAVANQTRMKQIALPRHLRQEDRCDETMWWRSRIRAQSKPTRSSSKPACTAQLNTGFL
jgi:hypothetical protein